MASPSSKLVPSAPAPAAIASSLPLPAFAARLLDPYRHLIRAFIYARPWLLVLFRVYKYVFGLASNTSELFRLCAREVGRAREVAAPEGAVSAECIHEIDLSLLYSNQLAIERRAIESKECGLEEVTQMVMLKKRFPGNGSLETPEAKVLFAALSVIHESHLVVAEINARVTTKYDSLNKAHERKLLELWALMMPSEPLTGRISEQWTKIGFQGKDPATDFRGMGMQGLDDLVYMARVHPKLTARLLAASHHPISWFSLAIVGINVTAYVVHLLRTRRLQYVLYRHRPVRDTVHEFYCYVMDAFERHWTGHQGHPPLTIMDFEREFARVKEQVERALAMRGVGLEPGWADR